LKIYHTALFFKIFLKLFKPLLIFHFICNTSPLIKNIISHKIFEISQIFLD